MCCHGFAWTFRDSALKSKAAYFDPKEWEEQSILDEETYYQQLCAVFARDPAPLLRRTRKDWHVADGRA